MRLFACSSCGQLVFFENVACTRCGHALAYLPERGVMSAIEAVGGPRDVVPARSAPGQLWQAAGGGSYRLCRNWTDYDVCNWALAADDPQELCRACRLNLVIPDLSDPAARAAWSRLEAAKRRLVYSLNDLGLPVEPKPDAPDGGLGFSFLKERDGEKVWTGHSDGVITINVAEADDPFREKTRVELGETYRTVLGHFRHEIGHYYWARLVQSTRWEARFRELFGDERVDYAEAARRHYDAGPPSDWPVRFVSAYASMHPWEDWAETFAHYLHVVDTLETARAHNLSVRLEPIVATGDREAGPAMSSRGVRREDFDQLIGAFVPLTLTLNDLNRSMGLRDPYPFVLSPAAIEKLRLVHEIIDAGDGYRSLSAGDSARPRSPS